MENGAWNICLEIWGKPKRVGAAEMVEQLRLCTCLTKDQNLIPITHSTPITPPPGYPMLSSDLPSYLKPGTKPTPPPHTHSDLMNINSVLIIIAS